MIDPTNPVQEESPKLSFKPNEQVYAGIFFAFFGLVMGLAGRIIFKNSSPNDPLPIFISTLLGGYFIGVGLLTILLNIFNVESRAQGRIFGLLGLFSASLPATLALPALFYLFDHRPNFFYEATLSAIPDKHLIYAGIASTIGFLLDGIGVFFLFNRKKNLDPLVVEHESKAHHKDMGVEGLFDE